MSAAVRRQFSTPGTAITVPMIGVGLLGRGVPCRGAAQPCGGAHRSEREILVVFQFRKAVQHLAEDFPFGLLCAAFVLQHFQAVEIETRLYRAEQFALCLGISPATAREQKARVLVQHSKSPPWVKGGTAK